MQNADVYAPPECAVELPVPTVRSTAYVGDLVIKAQIDATLGSRLSMRIGRHVHVGWERTGRLVPMLTLGFTKTPGMGIGMGKSVSSENNY